MQRVPIVKTLPTFLRVLEALRVGWWNSTPRFASKPERRNENINVNKNFISSSVDRTHDQSILQSLYAPALLLASGILSITENIHYTYYQIVKVYRGEYSTTGELRAANKNKYFFQS